MVDTYKNSTGTDLELLQKIEKAWNRNNTGGAKRNTSDSLDWFRKYVGRSFNKIGTGAMFRDRKMWKETFKMGRMYFFEYDAKHKATLPLWDRYPMIVPFSAYTAKDGMTIIVGLNFHYLQPALRMLAFKSLLKFRSEKRYRKNTRIDIEWAVISKMAESKYFKHAVHSYRLDHLRSKLVEIPAQSWEMALFLPTARFIGDKSQLKI